MSKYYHFGLVMTSVTQILITHYGFDISTHWRHVAKTTRRHDVMMMIDHWSKSNTNNGFEIHSDLRGRLFFSTAIASVSHGWRHQSFASDVALTYIAIVWLIKVDSSMSWTSPIQFPSNHTLQWLWMIKHRDQRCADVSTTPLQSLPHQLQATSIWRSGDHSYNDVVIARRPPIQSPLRHRSAACGGHPYLQLFPQLTSSVLVTFISVTRFVCVFSAANEEEREERFFAIVCIAIHSSVQSTHKFACNIVELLSTRLLVALWQLQD